MIYMCSVKHLEAGDFPEKTPPGRGLVAQAEEGRGKGAREGSSK